MCAINDPLGQTHSLASSDHYLFESCFVLLDFEKWTTRAKIVITTGRDCGSASWINNKLMICGRIWPKGSDDCRGVL